MKLFSKVGAVVVVALACAAPLGTAGCGSDFRDEPGQPVEKTGTLTTALSTVGSDGATYTFVVGTSLILSSGSWASSYPFDGSETVFTKSLGVGSYNLDLQFGAYGAPVLTRTTATETKNVNAIWTDAKPVTFGITANTTTNVVLHFSVPGIADVTFDTGQVSITAEVTKNDSATPGHVSVSGSVTVNSVQFDDPSASYASFFAATPGDVRQFAIGLNPTGPWAYLGDTACLPVTVGSMAFASGVPAFDERILQFLFGAAGTGSLCIRDEGADDLMELRLSADGPVPASQTSVLPNPPYQRSLYTSGRVGNVLDGATLHQTLLENQVTTVSGGFDHRLYKDGVLLTMLVGSMTTGGLRTDPPLGP